MSYTLLMTWDIRPNLEQEYFQFIVSEWVPATNRLGLQIASAWYTYYRDNDTVPMIRVEALTEDLEAMKGILKHADWHDIQTRLFEYVTNYKQKVLETSGEFKM